VPEVRGDVPEGATKEQAMSVTRLFRWSCDFCPLVIEREPWGKPQELAVIKANVLTRKPTRHAREPCLKGMDARPNEDGSFILITEP
jgi:hypothetical protein